MAKITKSFLASIDRKPTKRTFFWDDELKGFGVIVQPSGAASYTFQYRNGPKTRRVTIGPLGNLAPAEARAIAHELAYEVAKGNDPVTTKQQKRSAKTVAEVLVLYTESDRFAENSPETQSTDRGRIKRHLIPTIGAVLMHQLKETDVKAAIRDITHGKTAVTEKTKSRGLARVSGGEGTARKSLALLKAAFSWAESEGVIKSNPCRAMKVQGGKRRTFVLDPAGYAAVFQAIDALVNERSLHPATAAAIQLVALTGCRRGEIVNLKWENVDLRAGRLVINEHKTRRKTGEPIIIGLDSLGQQILSAQPPGKANDYVFSTTPGKSANLNKPMMRIRERAGLPKEFCLHSFRHSLATAVASRGATAHELQALLGHKTLSMASHYVHFGQDLRAQIGRRASGPVAAIMKGEQPADVIKI